MNRRAFFGTLLAVSAPKPSLTAPVAPRHEITVTVCLDKAMLTRTLVRGLPAALYRLQAR